MNKSFQQTIIMSLCALGMTATAEAKSHHHHHHSSSSSSSDFAKHCCKDIKKELDKIEDNFTCDKVHEISHLPYIVKESGKYCVKKNLTYTGSSAAITVLASNVTINMANHDLTLTNPAAQGFIIDGASEVTIENDAIVYTTVSTIPTGIAIHLLNATKVTLDNLEIMNAYIGVRSEESSDVTIQNSHIREATAAHVSSLNTNGLTVNNCFMFNTLENLVHAGNDFQGTDHIRFTNTKLFNSDIFYRSGDDCLVENVTSILDDSTYKFSAFQLGIGAGEAHGPFNVTNVIAKNCTFLIRDAAPESEGIQITQAHAVLLQDITVDAHPAGVAKTDDGSFGGIDVTTGAKLAIGDNVSSAPPSFVSDVKVVNCIFSSSVPSAFGITITASDTPNNGVVIEDCIIDNCAVAGIYVLNTINSTIKNNEVHRSGDGIVLDADSIHDKLYENNVMDNDGDGISVLAGASQNLLYENKVFGNTGNGINNAGSATETYFNTSCNNGGINCIGVFPQQAPGDSPAVAGSNICCEQIQIR